VTRSRIHLPLLFAALLAAGACDEALRPADRDPADLASTVASGDLQRGVVGEALADSLVVEVRDRRGRPVAGLPVEWRLLSDAGGALAATASRTDGQGRAGNRWTLGTRAGEQLVEVRALLRGGPAVLDTLRATARPGAAATLRVVGDTARQASVGDTLRVSLEARDRHDNVVPDSALRTAWSSADPAVAAVDSAGRVRALREGAAEIRASAGTATARLRLVVAARTDTFPLMLRRDAMDFRFHQNGGRLVAMGEQWFLTGANAWVAEPVGGVWTARQVGGYTPVAPPHLYVTPGGHAFAVGAGSVYYSPRPGEWRSHPVLSASGDIVGSGARTLAFSWVWNSVPTVYRVYSVEGETATASEIPAPPIGFVRRAAMSGGEIYAADDSITLFWNGSAWRPVSWPAGAAKRTRLLESPPEGEGVFAVVGENELYELRAGAATRVAHPLEARGERITQLAVSRDGRPYLGFGGGGAWPTGSGWKEHTVGGGLRVMPGIWPDADGSVWLVAGRPTGQFFGLREQLDFLFLRVRTGVR
jgi:hypothetical protein